MKGNLFTWDLTCWAVEGLCLTVLLWILAELYSSHPERNQGWLWSWMQLSFALVQLWGIKLGGLRNTVFSHEIKIESPVPSLTKTSDQLSVPYTSPHLIFKTAEYIFWMVQQVNSPGFSFPISRAGIIIAFTF